MKKKLSFKLKYSILVFLTLCFFSAYSQKTDSTRYPFSKWTPDVLKAASVNQDITYMTAEEKKVIFLMNLARMNGKLFCQTYAQMYFDQQDTVDYKNRYVSTLIDELEKLPKLPPFKCDKDLYESSHSHAVDMGISGKIGHTNYTKRMAAANKKFATTGENCDYGNNDALEIVMSLLIDEDVYDFGHRRNIFDKEYSYTAVSIQPHKEFEYNCVMDFGGGTAYAHNTKPVKKKNLFSRNKK
ncbi:MAG: CAP domain-containing protein [Bacteroidota bacterium]